MRSTDPEWLKPPRSRFKQLWEAGDKSRLVEELTALLSTGDVAPWALEFRGVARCDLGDVTGGLDDLTRAIEMDPELKAAHRSRGAAWWASSQPEQALVDLTRAVELDDTDAWAFALRGGVRHELGDLSGAIEDLTRAIELDPDDVWAISVRAAAFDDAGQPKHALLELSRAIESHPEDPWLRAKRCKIRLRELGMGGILDASDPWSDDFAERLFALVPLMPPGQAVDFEAALDDMSQAFALDASIAFSVLLPLVGQLHDSSSADSSEARAMRWIRVHQSGDLEAIVGDAARCIRPDRPVQSIDIELMILDAAIHVRSVMGVARARAASAAICDVVIGRIDRLLDGGVEASEQDRLRALRDRYREQRRVVTGDAAFEAEVRDLTRSAAD